MDKQLTLTKRELKGIGFTYSTKMKRWVMPTVNGFIYHNPKQQVYKWYLRTTIGDYSNDIHLSIPHVPYLFALLQMFQIKFTL